MSVELIDWVPWVVTALAVPQVWLMRAKNRNAWLFSIMGCAVYSFATQQYGFIPTNVFFLAASASNYAKWKQDDAVAAVSEVEGVKV